jgi:hypothetical protein
MTKNLYVIVGLAAISVAACSRAAGSDAMPADGSSPSTASQAMPAASTSRTVSSGTNVDVTIDQEISSRKYSAGHMVPGSVSSDVLDSRGRVVIPAGSPVNIEITRIAPSDAGHPSAEGVLELTVTSITVNGTVHEVRTVVNSVPHSMKGRGITKGQGTDVAVGAAVGALAGQLIGKNTKGTVIGGAVGAVGGGAVAVAGAQRDIIVAPGTHISISLPQAITVN